MENKKIRLLLVSSYLDDGGAEKWMLDTLKHMNKTNVYIDYYFWCDVKVDTFVQQYKDLGVHLYFRKLNEKIGKSLLWLQSDLRKFIKQNGPYDAIHVNGTRIYQQMVIMNVAKNRKIPVRMVHSHNSKSSNLTGIKKSLRTYFRKKTINDATIVGGCSKLATTTKYGESVLSSGKYFIFKNGIDYKKYERCTELRNKNRSDLKIGNEPVFLHIGRFNVQKNHPFLIKIFSEIVKQQNNAKLILIGHGDDESKIINQIKELKLEDNIIHIPYTTETEKYYSAADLFLFPSLYEGLPLVLLEAQASGIPCIISDVISKEVLVNDNVVQLPLDSPSVWCENVLKLAGKRCDKAQENIYNSGYDVDVTSAEFLNCCKGI